jgi:GTP-binding protein LepA
MNISQMKWDFKLNQVPKKVISTGDVGYLISGIKEAKEVKVGDTVTDAKTPTTNMVKGFEDVKPMVFAGFILLIPKIMKT